MALQSSMFVQPMLKRMTSGVSQMVLSMPEAPSMVFKPGLSDDPVGVTGKRRPQDASSAGVNETPQLLQAVERKTPRGKPPLKAAES
eukprot:256611-Amphidinium_carterae.1